MEECHNVLYALYTNFLLRIVLTILMRYMFLKISYGFIIPKIKCFSSKTYVEQKA